jgi:DNA polymerase III epsilon subunit-like protein
MFGTHITTGGMVGRTSDGRTPQTMADWATLTYAVVDVEGNGQQPPELVELAVVPIVGGEIKEPTSWLVRPSRPIQFFVTRIHGLSDTDVADYPPFAEIREQVLAALDVDALVAHNAHVDVGVLGRHLGDWQAPEVFDTLRLARRLIPGMTSYKLGSLVEALSLTDSVTDGLQPHRATYDALVTARLFYELAITAGSLEGLRDHPPGGGSGETAALF